MMTAEKNMQLARLLGLSAASLPLLEQALTHRSFLHENPKLKRESYERLEFLGDAVLSLVMSRLLYQRYPDKKEGELSKLRSSIVNESTLAEMARFLQLSDYIFAGKGERAALGGPILADVLEALFGVVYLELGELAVQELWLEWQKERGIDLLAQENLEGFDAKSRLQEFCMKHFKLLPEYNDETSQKGFRVTLILAGRPLLSTENISKKKASLWLAETCLKNNLHRLIQGDTSCF
jgi:ribonuclease III